ncbi:pilus assembly protein TadG-related protein [Phenylobacterium sp.]|jgi:Flp pilus assembly protein TadG|uniref:pilus assembly protein TadG-related protein n=1 Tax=Phenylobacterium sp. TaxID=1871053 RepID=UPI0037837422
MISDLVHDRSGASAITVGVSMVALLGLVGLGVDAGGWYNLRRQAQHAADSAAYSAAVGMSSGDDVTTQARAVAARYGLRHDVGGVAVQVGGPPTSGAFIGDTDAVEVTVTRPAPRFLSGLFMKSAPTIRARAVARMGAAANACVVAFNKVEAYSVLINGNPEVNLEGCSLYANSANSQALLLNGSATLRAESVELVGGYFTNGSAVIDAESGVHTGRKALPDPYADVPLPPYESLPCTTPPTINSGGTYDLAPAAGQTIRRYCNGGFNINGNATVNLAPGVYVFDRSAFIINGGARVTGKDVTIVLTSSTGSNYSTLTMNGDSYMDLKAPTSGSLAGLLFYQDRRAPSGNNIINGGATANFQGALYFPKQTVTFNGGAQAGGGSQCIQLLADEVLFNGNATFRVNCAGAGVRLGGGGKPGLVE